MYRARLVRVLALAAVLSLGVAGCAQDADQQPQTQNNDQNAADQNGGPELESDPAPTVPPDLVKPAGDGNATCPEGTALAYAGTIAGVSPQLGINILNGAKLAVKEHNDANPNCQVTLKEFDTGGTPETAAGPVTQIINDRQVLGIVGVAFSGESNAVGPSLSRAGLVSVSASATNPALADNGWKHFFRGLGNDAVQGPALVRFMEQLGSENVCVVQDDSEYGIGLAGILKQELGDKLACETEVKTDQREFSAVVGEVINNAPDTVFFSGYYPEAAPFTQQLRDQGFEGDILVPDGVRDQEFVKNAGEAAEGVYLSCPCLPTAGFADFTKGYLEVSGGQPPGTYSPEAYDAATILLRGIDEGNHTRADLLEYVKNYQGQGLTKFYEFSEKGEVKETPVWMYQVEGNEIVHFKDVSE